MQLLLVLSGLVSLIAIAAESIPVEDQQLFYRIPNPFGSGGSGELKPGKVKGYFAIESCQSSLSAARETEQYKVQEYFSLEEGLTFSLHKDRNDPDRVFAIIGDSNHGKTYIVSKQPPGGNGDVEGATSKSPDGSAYQCELDNVHHHRYVFPWVFKYRLPELANSGKRRRPDRNRDGFIYGIGGIWLNAIDRKIISNLVGDNSPVPGSNVWTIEQGDLRVRMLFDKPEPEPEPEGDSDEHKLEQQIAVSKLNNVRIRRLGVVGHMGGSSSFYGSELKQVYVRSAGKLDDPLQDETLGWLLSLLPLCRRQSRKHRVFPSLVRAVSIAPQRLYHIRYVETKFAPHDDVKSGEFGPQRHRRVYDRELHSEWFSFKREAFSILHQGLEGGDGEQHMFIKLFTQNKDAQGGPTAVSYHQVLDGQGKLQGCIEGEAEHPPHDNLMVRAVHFHQSEGHRLSSLLRGLGALLMNALDVHHKEYSLFTLDILRLDDPSNLDSRIQVKANKWQFHDKRSGRTIHFYFKHKNIKRQDHDISDLIRIDIKLAAKWTDEEVVPVKTEPFVDGGDDPEFMVRRFDIISLETEADPEEIERALRPDRMCRPGGAGDNPAEVDDFEQNDANFEDSLDDLDQLDGEAFEFEPAKMMNSLEFPDFFEFLDGEPAYTIESSIEIRPPASAKDSSSHQQVQPTYVTLRERVDFETEQTVLSVFVSAGAEQNPPPDFEYYINYNSELVFRTSGSLHQCRLVGAIEEGWLQTLSAQTEYYRVPGRTGSPKDSVGPPEDIGEQPTVESSKLRIHGVGALWRQAAQSEESQFVGLKKEIVLKGEHKYKEVIWSWEPTEEADENGAAEEVSSPRYEFGFYWNLTKWRQDQEKQVSRRTLELLSLNWLQFTGGNKDTVGGIRILPVSIKRSSSAPWLLPDYCAGAIADAERISEEEAKVFHDKVKVPSVLDVVGASKTYEAQYTITHSRMSDLLRDATEPNSFVGGESSGSSSTMAISESFDGQNNRAKLTFARLNSPDGAHKKHADRREVYIEGQAKRIGSLFVKANICKPLAKLEGLVNLGPTTNLANSDFRVDRMYGLGALWLLVAELANRKSATLKVTHRYRASGDKQEIRTYKVRTSFPTSQMGTVEYTIELRFSATTGAQLKALAQEPRFDLEMIDFLPKQARGRKEMADLHRTTIAVVSFGSHKSPTGWPVPEACATVFRDRDGPAAESFPRISELLRQVEVFHMRSEITSQSPLVGQARSLFLLDEWFFAGKEKIRLRSSRLAKDLDILLLVDTNESFDLSSAHQCRSRLPKLFSNYHSGPTGLTSKVMNFWRDEETLPEKLAQLYFGPLSLWWLAEKNLANVKLASSMELAPLPVAPDKCAPQCGERELRLESWLVTSPPDVSPAWRFEMKFEKKSKLPEEGLAPIEWHSLESVSLADPEYLGLTTEVEIDVISYKQEEASRDIMLSTFEIPEGLGCPRSLAALDLMCKLPDELDLQVNREFRISYEASLELHAAAAADDDDDDDSGGGGDDDDANDSSNKIILPTLSGRLLSTGRATESPERDAPPRRIDVMSHGSMSRLPDGRTRSTKTIYDRLNKLLFGIQRSTGFCSIDRVESYDWTLEFSGRLGESETQLVVLNATTFDLLFLRTVGLGFAPLNRWEFGGVCSSTYERQVDNLVLSDQLQGPAVVIRTYQNLDWEPPRVQFAHDRQIRQHDSLSVKVLLFKDRARTKLRASLGMRLWKAFNTDLSVVIDSINVAQCYNDGSPSSDKRSATFAIEYANLPLDSMEWVLFNMELVEERFTRQLVERARIMPIQFVLNPNIDFDRFEPPERTMRITFTLLEPPTALEYFHGGAQLDLDPSRFAFVGELRLVEDIQVCSKWCDRVDCTAMTYCEPGHLCRVVTSNMLRHEPALLAAIKEGKAGAQSEQCSFFYYTREQFDRPQTLDGFGSFADFAVNEPGAGQEPAGSLAEAFALHLDGVVAWPSKFLQESDDFWSFREDSISPDAGYSLLLADKSLDPAKLNATLADHAGYALEHLQASSYAKCLMECRSRSCILASYSRQTQLCQLVSGAAELRPLLGAEALRDESPADQYTITVRNYLSEYTRFGGTREPHTFERQLAHYSPVECGSACSSYAPDGSEKRCLSFDYCHSSSSCYLQAAHMVADYCQSSSSCYLQAAHMVLDWLDHKIFQQDDQRTECEHYSRSVAADFTQLPNKRYQPADATGSGAAPAPLPVLERGVDLERCALSCQMSELCAAFEHCFDDTQRPAQSCRHLVLPAREEQDASGRLEDLLVPAAGCSVYRLGHIEEELRWQSSGGNSSRSLGADDHDNMSKLWSWFGWPSSLLLLAVSVGLLVQTTLYRVFGLSLTFCEQ